MVVSSVASRHGQFLCGGRATNPRHSGPRNQQPEGREKDGVSAQRSAAHRGRRDKGILRWPRRVINSCWDFCGVLGRAAINRQINSPVTRVTMTSVAPRLSPGLPSRNFQRSPATSCSTPCWRKHRRKPQRTGKAARTSSFVGVVRLRGVLMEQAGKTPVGTERWILDKAPDPPRLVCLAQRVVSWSLAQANFPAEKYKE